MLLARCLVVFALCLGSPGLWSAEAPTEPTSELEYVEIAPAFVVNVGSSGRVAFLKAGVTLRTARQATPLVELHMPALRHQLIMLLSRQEPEALDSPEKREALRLEAREDLRGTLKSLANDDGIEDLLFTTFIIQR